MGFELHSYSGGASSDSEPASGAGPMSRAGTGIFVFKFAAPGPASSRAQPWAQPTRGRCWTQTFE